MPHLTSIDPELDKRVKATPPGMAHWAGTGPDGATCGQCRHYGYDTPLRNAHDNVIGTVEKLNSCRRFFELMRRHGKPLPPLTPSCRHFRPRG
jgi:hypothetical protein